MAVNLSAKSQQWDFKGGRHNRMESYQGSSGLWYCQATFGSGRYCDKWALYVFPAKRPAFSNYGRAFKPEDVLPMDYCLLVFNGEGGYDTGKSAFSKGGYRSGGSIPYVYNDKEFDPKLLRDGDEFLKQVLGYEPSAEGIKRGIAQDEEIKRLAAIAEEERKQQWHEEYQRKEAEAKAQQAANVTLFAGVEMPAGWHFSVRSDGLRVWRPDSQFGDQKPWFESVFPTLEAFEAWKAKEIASQAKEAEERAIRDAREAAEKAKYEAEAAAKQKRIDELKGGLPNIRNKLGKL